MTSDSVEHRRTVLPAVVSIAIIVIATVAALRPVVKCGFTTWDDQVTVSENQNLKPPGLHKLIHHWTHAAMGLYVPVTYTFWSAVAFLSPPPLLPSEPMKLDPALFHGANLLVHILSAVLVWAILRQCLRKIAPTTTANFASCIGALLFALHPVQVESVAWVSGAKDLLEGFFSLIAIRQYIAAIDAPRASTERVVRYLITLGAAGFAMLSKPSAMVLPLVIVIIDWLILQR